MMFKILTHKKTNKTALLDNIFNVLLHFLKLKCVIILIFKEKKSLRK